MNMARGLKGFTIIELLVVVIVIGVLAAAGMTKYQGFAENAKQKTCIAQQLSLENAVAVWCTQNTAIPEDGWGSAPFEAKSGYAWNTWWGSQNLPFGINGNNWGIADTVRDNKTFTCPRVVQQYGSLQNTPWGWFGIGCWANCYIYYFTTPSGGEPYNGGWYYIPYAAQNRANFVFCPGFGYYACNPPQSYKYKHANRWN
ncbi:MAG: prepilin-type N-terminal cleavage/methylation domain-containing protein, partial [Candidatus Riflebacteria bacterium]|nr:prepilin-type N-terminal cleavage/methylation domain-containing protein [Candidatus Riflebacteria bacterium]